MIKEIQLRLLPEEAANESSLRHAACRATGESPEAIHAVRLLKRSIDARQQTIYVNVTLRLFIHEMPQEEDYPRIDYRDVSGKPAAVVVGAGPAGLFAALRLIERGVRPIVIERGKPVRERRGDIALISREQRVDPESNYCFGEGGAGAFSDGKLYTRSKKRGSVERILRIFCQHGANHAILVDAHPHIGTEKLPMIIEQMRKQILQCGGEVHFQTCMRALLIREGSVVGVESVQGETFQGPVILATGHSARDVYRYLAAAKIPIEAKGLALGVRLEHPQALIDRIRYHRPEGRGDFLPAAEYNFVTQVNGRGVYSFCMCPGGFIVPAASGPEELVVNGMSPANRGSRWANSGMVVEMRPDDLGDDALKVSSHAADLLHDDELLTSTDCLAMMRLQQQLERLCWREGGAQQTAPTQRMDDFVRGKRSAALPRTSYTPGVVASPLHQWLPPFITSRLKEGFRHFDKVSRGFMTNEAIMIGVETRTSSPVRIVRDRATYEHVTLKGLFPCGEGAGYAGGIVSAAIDGEACADRVASLLGVTDQ